ncbi:hypothetical protein I4U23_022608 [Adineta vaga]|nr:hypothetical protein I4U23_022608 [Adineta vaga]
MNDLRLDHLPLEIIYTIFDYLSAHDILLTFSNLNSTFDTISSTYPSYQFEFKSIPRSHFDLVCSRISPNHVISLTLSDQNDTPGQSELFFSRYQITDFTGLRLLKAIDIEHKSWLHIYPYLRKLNDFHRLSIELTNVNLLPHIPILFHASELQIASTNLLQTPSLPYLRHLTATQSSINELLAISSSARLLQSLKINNVMFNTNHQLLLPAQRLIRLVLHFNDNPVSMDQMKQLMVNLPRLQYLELLTSGSIDLINGYAWERLTRRLIMFEFKFFVQIDWIEDILHSFRTPFWIREKQWFVACTWECLYSVPYFSDTCTDTSFLPPVYTTAPNDDIFFNHINQLSITNSTRTLQGYFRHVKSLELKVSNSHQNLSIFIDLNQIETLILSTIIDRLTVLFLLTLLPRLRQLSITCELAKFLDETENISLGQIRILEITEPLIYNDFSTLGHLARLFPNVEVLHVKSIQWKIGIARLMDRLENLSNATFQLVTTKSVLNQENETESSMIKTIIDETRYLKNETFSCRCTSLPTTIQNHITDCHFWIDKQKRKSSHEKYWFPQRGDRYYRLNHFIEHNIFSKLFQYVVLDATMFFFIIYALLHPAGQWGILLFLFLAEFLLFMASGSSIDPLLRNLDSSEWF